MNKKVVSLFLLLSIAIAITPPRAYAAIKAGDSCKRVGVIKKSSSKAFICKSDGKVKIWRKLRQGAEKPQSKSISKPTDWEDLFEKRAGISIAAWEKSSEIIKSNKPKNGKLEIYTGPNTIPYFDDYPKAIGLVSRLFPESEEPDLTLVFRYKFVDLEWAEMKFKEVIGEDQFNQMNSTENGRLIHANCNFSNSSCPNSMQQSSRQGVNVILQGFRNTDEPNDATGKLRFYSGMLEAHEYFHALQRIPIMGKPDVIWPHAWFREGGAEWVQTATTYFEDYKTYREYLRLDCLYECQKLSEEDISDFLKSAKENYLPPRFSPWLNYSLGAHLIEALVALKGPQTLIEMYAQMGDKNSFEEAFKKIYGTEWNKAIPILAKTMYANFKNI